MTILWICSVTISIFFSFSQSDPIIESYTVVLIGYPSIFFNLPYSIPQPNLECPLKHDMHVFGQEEGNCGEPGKKSRKIWGVHANYTERPLVLAVVILCVLCLKENVPTQLRWKPWTTLYFLNSSYFYCQTWAPCQHKRIILIQWNWDKLGNNVHASHLICSSIALILLMFWSNSFVFFCDVLSSLPLTLRSVNLVCWKSARNLTAGTD